MIVSVSGGVNGDLLAFNRRKVLDFMVHGQSCHVSVVVPLHNEADNLGSLVERALRALEPWGNQAELILVDDASSDRTLGLARDWEERAAERVRVVELRSRQGQHLAVMAGFAACRGLHIITLDGDLQNPPEEIPRFVRRLESGVDLVTGTRSNRQDHLLRRLLSRVLHLLGPLFTGLPAHDYGSMFRGYSRALVERMLASGSRSPYVPALAIRAARSSAEIEVAHAARNGGKSKYGWQQLCEIALDLGVGASDRPFYLIAAAGGLALASSAIGLVIWLVVWLSGAAPNWSTIPTLLVVGALGLVLVTQALLGAASRRNLRRVQPPDPPRTEAATGATEEGPRVLLCGYREVGYAVLSHLLQERVQVVAVATHPDSPHERECWPSVCDLATREHLPVLLSGEVRSAAFVARLSELRVNMIVSAYYRRILPPPVLALATRGAFNLHPSLLPAYRGRAPINWALLRGERETGFTIHEMEEAADAGAIVAQVKLPIDPEDDAGSLSAKLAIAGSDLFRRVWPALRDGDYEARPQDETQAFWVGKRTRADGRIDWNASASTIRDLVRAVAKPFPGAFTGEDEQQLTIWRCTTVATGDSAAEVPAGTVLPHEQGWIVRCGDGGLLLPLEIQLGQGPCLSGAALEGLLGQLAGRRIWGAKEA